MGVRRGGRKVIGALLAVNMVVYLIVLGLAGWSLNKYIDGQHNSHPHDLGGNSSTTVFLVRYALSGGVIGACSVFLGCAHLRAWNKYSLASAASLAITSYAITTLAFGLVCKQFAMGGQRGKRLQTLEAFIVISCVSQLVYLLLLHSGILCSTGYRPTYRD